MIWLLFILFLGSNTYAATGDILYQNCTSASSCTGAGTSSSWIRTVETSGCHTGSCLKLVGLYNPADDGRYGAGTTSLSTGSAVAGHREITVSQWTKYDELARNISGGNLKLDRPYTDSGSLNFYSADIQPHWGNDYYLGAVIGLMINKASWFVMSTSNDPNSYPTDNGDGTYTVKGYIHGKYIDGPTPPGTTWTHSTKYMKTPSSPTATDGHIKYWADGQLVFEIINAGFQHVYPGTVNFYKLNFYPSSEATEPFEHWEDDMIIYEGYVPPSEETCLNFAGLCTTEEDCASNWPTYNWCADDSPSCTSAACSVNCSDTADECLTETECTANWPTYNWCPGDTPSCTSSACSNTCSSTNFWLCGDYTTCESVGRYWWGEACRNIANPSDMTGSNLIINGNLSEPGNINSWTLYNSADVEETTLGLNLTNDGTIAQDPNMVVGTSYRFVANLISLTGNFREWTYNNEDQVFTTVGTITGIATLDAGGDDRIFFKAGGINSDIVVNDIALYERTLGTCDVNNLQYCNQTECEALSPTHYWWNSECHATAQVGLINQNGLGSVSASTGTGTISQQ